jgi:hypothetical protein
VSGGIAERIFNYVPRCRYNMWFQAPPDESQGVASTASSDVVTKIKTFVPTMYRTSGCPAIVSMITGSVK